MKRNVLFSLFACLAVSGCGIFNNVFIAAANQRGSTPGGAPSTCALPAGVQIALVYPANGSTGIPDNFGQVIFAASGSGLSSSYHAYLVDESNNKQLNFNGMGAWNQALPQPAATPSFANPAYVASPNGGTTFPQGHLLTVRIQENQCAASGALGAFTVQ